MIRSLIMRKTIVVLLICMLSILSACANEKTKSNDDQTVDKQASTTLEKVELTISAAASLNEALTEIKALYENKNENVALLFNFGGSGALQQQISHGASTDLFFSAAENKFNLLVEEGRIDENNKGNLLKNQLVLIVPNNEKIEAMDFKDLTKDQIEKIAVGTPESVPAGQYAKESLETLGLWGELESKLIFTKDVRQVLTYVETNNVDAGIVYKTDAAISQNVKIVAEADEQTHTPIIYPAGVLKDSKQLEAAQEFFHYLKSDEARKIFEQYGFVSF